MSVERRHVLLLEIQYWKKVLLENRLDFLKTKYIPLLKKAIETGIINLTGWDINDPDQVEDEVETVFRQFVNADPDLHKKNVQWMLNVILSGKSFIEDLSKANHYLQLFEKFKRQLPVEQRDLNKYKSFADLYAVIEPFEQQQTKGEADRAYEAEMNRQAQVLYNSNNYKIIVPLTREASCHFGKNTQWCTASTGSYNYFDSYNREGPLYIILDKKNNRRWQYHFATGQFMDENDSPVNIHTFIAEHGEAWEALKETLPKAIATVNYESTPCPVYQAHNGFIIKDSKSQRLLMNIYIENGYWNKTRMRIGSANDYSSKDIAELFNKFDVKGDDANNSHNIFSHNIFDIHYRDGKWKTILELIKPFLRFSDKTYWGIFRPDDNTYRYLLIFDNEYICEATLDDSDGKFLLVDTISTSKKVQKLGTFIVDLLLKINAKEWVGNSNYRPSQLSGEDAKRLMEKKPWLGDLSTTYKVYGITKDTKKLLIKELVENEIQHYNKWLDGDKLVIETFSSVDDCVEELGTRDGKGFYEQFVKENNNIEYYSNDMDVDRYQATKFLEYLFKTDPQDFKKLGEHLAENYSNIVEEQFENYDPSNFDNVKELFEESDDEELMTAMKVGVASGLETGASNEAYEIARKAIESNDYLYFTTGVKEKAKKAKWSNKIKNWDGAVTFAVPMATIINLLNNPGPYELSNEGWASSLDAEIDMREPYNGFTDYDDETANEMFVEWLQGNVLGLD